MAKPKFTPEITRIKLNPEQAVLACGGYTRGYIRATSGTRTSSRAVCSISGTKSLTTGYYTRNTRYIAT